ncbi:MAG TPA: arginyltransferase [Gammaproteobacteria bacterium]
MKNETPSQRLLLFATPPHACGYLPSRAATTVFADPRVANSPGMYTVLSSHGFRRSGDHLYRPQCAECSACVPVRIPVRRFRPRRSQCRVWKRNADLEVVARDAAFDPSHFELYRDYMHARHRGGSMDNPGPEQYRGFLCSSWADSQFLEFRLGSRLAAVAVCDRLGNGLSAVYTFFDPGLSNRSLGAYAILWEIEQTRRLGLDWLYLGYWIEASSKMRYKSTYRPQQRLIDGRWREV